MPGLPLEGAEQDSADTKVKPVERDESTKSESISDESRTELYDQFKGFSNAFEIEDFSPAKDSKIDSESSDNEIELSDPFKINAKNDVKPKGGGEAKDSKADSNIEFDNPFTVEKAAQDVAKNAKSVDGQAEGGGEETKARAAGDKGTIDAQKAQGDAVAVEKQDPVKLEKMKFDESQVKEALDLAKKHNLPVAVYTGATWCPACPSASAKFNDIAHDMEGQNETPAVLIKLDADKANRLASQNTDEGKALKEFMGDANRIPNVAIYNPNDVTNPISDSTVANWGKDMMKGHMDKAINQVRKDLGNESTDNGTTGEKATQSEFSERNLKEAIQKAKEADLPLLTHVDRDGNMDPKINKAFEYLNEQKLAVAANISAPKSTQMLQQGLETSHYNALNSVLKNQDRSNSFFGAANAKDIPVDLKFKSSETISPESTDETIKFMKDNGVDLSDSNHETAVRALLEGKPIPEVKEEIEPAPEDKDGADSFESVHSVKTVEEAKEVIELAKEKNLPIVAHAKTVICTDTSCTMKGLDPGAIADQKDKAIFMEIPRGGFSPEDVAGDTDLESINELFKVSDDDHKTELDINVFNFNESKNDAMEQRTTTFDQNMNLKLYLSDLLKDK